MKHINRSTTKGIAAYRMNHFRELAEDNGVPLYLVVALADILGPSEDYDGLVTEVEDAAREMHGDFDSAFGW